MVELFETKVRYEMVDEKGHTKKALDSYVIDAMNFSDVECFISRYLSERALDKEMISVRAIRRINISMFVRSEHDVWFKAKIRLQEEKKTYHHNVLVQAKDLTDAYDQLEEALERDYPDVCFAIVSVQKTVIVDALHSTPEEQRPTLFDKVEVSYNCMTVVK
ncbi:DUF4494 domain-containing protein [Halosquirtibacter xylanolyticus]|uniref:DUF4494 family protein n=1 Tax=Halosquirtibacter xylanolyticus TaxID=3374599 RepID=UPI00374963EB|nr:DUF4494 domain-containing protein [Prolixibacteraceae bacterium]